MDIINHNSSPTEAWNSYKVLNKWTSQSPMIKRKVLHVTDDILHNNEHAPHYYTTVCKDCKLMHLPEYKNRNQKEPYLSM